MQQQRELFDLPPEVVYLNGAYMSPQLRAVTAVGQAQLVKKARPWEIKIDDFFAPVNKLKATFAQLVNISNPERVAIVPSVSYGMANVAKNITLRPGQKIIVAAEQFPSNYYVWEKLAAANGAELQAVGPAPNASDRTAAMHEALLAAIDAQTAVVALGQIHWADGLVYDLLALRAATNAVGALLIIDGTQSVGAMPFDVAAIQPDALICAGYKWLLGPYTLGLAYYGPAFDQGSPIEENWISRQGSEDFQALVNYQPNYQPFASRYSMGEQSQFVAVPMLTTAMEQILAWGVESIQTYCAQLTARPLENLVELGCVIASPAQRAHHLIGVRLGAHFDPQKLAQLLQENQVYVSFRGSAIRIAPHVYNTPKDLEILVDCFRQSWS